MSDIYDTPMHVNYGDSPGTALILRNGSHGALYFTHDKLPGSGPLAFPIPLTPTVEIVAATPDQYQWAAERLARDARYLEDLATRRAYDSAATRYRRLGDV